jgi:hypothetical protein
VSRESARERKAWRAHGRGRGFKLPRGKRSRRNGGFLYTYGDAAIGEALAAIGGFGGWRLRLARRAARERVAAASYT